MEDIKKTGPRDVFFYLLAIIVLYFCAINFGILLFQYINIYFPDEVAGQFIHPAQYLGPLRWAISSLIIVFPVYIWVSRKLARELLANPEKRKLKTRKWLICFTLFAAAVIIIGDLVTLIFNFMNGELTVRFVLKVLVVFLITTCVFVYYTWNLKHFEPALKHPRMRIFAWGVITIITVSVICGFLVVGSPQSQRLTRFDEMRVNDLMNIQWQIVNFWQAKERLPNNLAELEDSISGYEAPLDPETKAVYEYMAIDRLNFELCASFNTATKRSDIKKRPQPVEYYPYYESENWSHGIGRECFKRTIDPERYPRLSKGD